MLELVVLLAAATSAGAIRPRWSLSAIVGAVFAAACALGVIAGRALRSRH